LIRGYLHTVIKVFEQRLPTSRGKTPKTVIKKFTTGKLPPREYPFRVLSACGEYAISTRNYVTNNFKNWRIPSCTERNLHDKTLKLYQQVLAKHDIVVDEDILKVDKFKLREKFGNCTKLVSANDKHRKALDRKMPSQIGKYLRQNI
jgi:hypothetical protein